MTLSALKPVHVAFGLMALLAGMVAFWPLGIGIDYYNHLARTYIQGHLASEPALQDFYAVSFDFIPDLTMDMIIPWLSQWIGIYAAGGVTVWLALILAPVAGLVLNIPVAPGEFKFKPTDPNNISLSISNHFFTRAARFSSSWIISSKSLSLLAVLWSILLSSEFARSSCSSFALARAPSRTCFSRAKSRVP